MAVIAASRFPVFKFVVSLMGPTLDMVEDRYLAEENAWKSRNPDRKDWDEIGPLWRGLMEAFAEDWAFATEEAIESPHQASSEAVGTAIVYYVGGRMVISDVITVP